MHILWRVAALAAIFGLLLPGADWPTQSGGPARDAWARGERAITKDNVHSLEVLYKYQSDNQAKGPNSLSTPIISGMLITYRGFKEMLVFSGSGDNVYSVDADLNRLVWKRHFDVKGSAGAAGTANCPAGLTTSVAMPGSSSAGFRAPGRPPEKDTKEMAKARARKEAEDKLASGFGRLGGMFTVSSDGYLHALNSSTGEDLLPSVPFVPPHSNLSSLNVMNNVVYAATTNHCGGKPNAVYGFDFVSDTKQVDKFELNEGEISGIGGTAIGGDGTVYLQVNRAKSGKAGKYDNTVLALTPDLKLKDYFKLPEGSPAGRATPQGGITPAVLTWKEKELVAVAGPDGRIYLLDTSSLGGSDHQKPLIQTEAITAFGGAAPKGAFSSWYEADSQIRWIYVPVTKTGDVATGGVVAYQLSDDKGSPVLKPAWASAEMGAPAAPATANGVVFVLSPGGPTTPATMHFLDGASGKNLSSKDNITQTYSYPGGVAVANGRVYFTTHDNAVYCLGFSKLNPQLTDR
jgi:outer membrane protein assembly factor BamB